MTTTGRVTGRVAGLVVLISFFRGRPRFCSTRRGGESFLCADLDLLGGSGCCGELWTSQTFSVRRGLPRLRAVVVADAVVDVEVGVAAMVVVIVVAGTGAVTGEGGLAGLVIF